MSSKKLKFSIKPENDVIIYNGFIETAKFYDIQKDLDIGFFNLYPKLKEIYRTEIKNKGKTKNILNFVKEIYEDSKEGIENGLRWAKENWVEMETPFFSTISKLFKNHKWPKGEYTAYITIWGTFPRFLKDKSFTFPFKFKNRNFVSYVIAHEMLHFIFYDYAIKKFPSLFKNLDTETGIFWDLAEIFNVIILSQPTFVKIHGYKEVKPYPQHKDKVIILKRYWQNSKNNIDNWIIKSFNYLTAGENY